MVGIRTADTPDGKLMQQSAGDAASFHPYLSTLPVLGETPTLCLGLCGPGNTNWTTPMEGHGGVLYHFFLGKGTRRARDSPVRRGPPGLHVWELVAELCLFTTKSPAPRTASGINSCRINYSRIMVFKADLLSNPCLLVCLNVDQLTENIKGNTRALPPTPYPQCKLKRFQIL